MGFLRECGNARRISSRSSAKWFTYQSVAIRCLLNEKARWRNQASALIDFGGEMRNPILSANELGFELFSLPILPPL